MSALKGNEDDAYERINKHEDKWPELTDRFIRALEEEGRHKRWLEQEEK